MNNEESVFLRFLILKTRTNIDGLIGKIGLVTKDIDNIQSLGEVQINHDYWGAINYDECEVIKRVQKLKFWI